MNILDTIMPIIAYWAGILLMELLGRDIPEGVDSVGGMVVAVLATQAALDR